MKKTLKDLIKKNKLSDDDLIKLISDASPSEVDIQDEESDSVGDSNDQPIAEKPSAEQEKAKTNMSMEELEKLIATSVANALKANKTENLLPSQLPLNTEAGTTIKKDIPKATQKNTDIEIGGFTLMA